MSELSASTLRCEPASGASGAAPRLPDIVRRRPDLEARVGPDTGAAWSLVAGPAGSGKTTLVRTWLEHRHEPWAWVGLEVTPDRSRDLTDRIVRGVQRARPELPLDALDLLDVHDESGVDVLTAVLDELGGESAGGTTLLILDDTHLLEAAAWEVLASLVRRLPASLHLVLVGRGEPPIPLERERAAGRLAEVHADDLAFDLEDTAWLVEHVAGPIEPSVVREVQARTAGWATGVALAARALRGGTPPAELADGLTGSGMPVAEFLAQEVLAQRSADQRGFLVEVSVLTVLDADLCDALTGRRDSARVLRSLAADGLVLAPVTGREGRYRAHPLIAELVRRQRSERDPGGDQERHRRVADWLIDHDRSIEAIEHLLSSGDHDRAHGLVMDHFHDLYIGAQRRDLDQWLLAMPDDVIAASLDRAVDHCVALALMGNDETARWWEYCSTRLGPGDRWARSRLHAVMALHQAVHGRPRELRRHWDEARHERPSGRVDPLDEILMHWAIRFESHLGEPAVAVRAARELVATPRRLLPTASALSGLAGALAAAGEADHAEALADEAVAVWRRDGEADLPGMLDALVVEAAASRRQGDLDRADDLVGLALALPPPRRGPHFLTSIALVERARIDHARGGSGWRTQLAFVVEALRVGGAADEVVAWAEGARQELICHAASEPAVVGLPASTVVPSDALVEDLTGRERTVLELLATHRSFPEIGEELHISRHTVRSHARRIYDKLGCTSRSEAIREARRLGILVEHAPS